MRRMMLAGAALLLAQAAEGAILYQSSLPANGGSVQFDDFLAAQSVTATGSTWIGISGGRIRGVDWTVEGEFSKYWWELVGEDDEGNQEIFLNGNDYFYNNRCSVTIGAPTCSTPGLPGVPGNLTSRLHNNAVRIDFSAPVSFNRCLPFDGVFDVDCAVIFNLQGAGFSVVADGPGDIVLTISDTHLAGAIPEPASWALLIAGFGLVGAVLRRCRLLETHAASRD